MFLVTLSAVCRPLSKIRRDVQRKMEQIGTMGYEKRTRGENTSISRDWMSGQTEVP